MSVYVARDIAVEDDGDLVFTDGDLEVATAEDSMKQYILTWLLTTRGAFLATPEVGWGGEGFIGRPNSPFTHDSMERDLGYAFSVAQDLNPSDLNYVVSYVNPDVAALTLRFNGLLIEKDGTSPQTGIVMTFSFPFYNGQIQQEVQA